MDNHWKIRFIEMAFNVSRWSKDPSSKIGAVAVSEDRRIIGTGFNGFSSHDKDDFHDYYIRDRKYPKIIHAEMNLLLNCLNAGMPIKGSTIFVYGQPVCSECAKVISNTGIKGLVAVWDHGISSTKRWTDEWEKESVKRFDDKTRIETFHYPDNRPDDLIVAAKKIDKGWEISRKNGSVDTYDSSFLAGILKDHDTKERYEKFDERLLRRVEK